MFLNVTQQHVGAIGLPSVLFSEKQKIRLIAVFLMPCLLGWSLCCVSKRPEDYRI